MAADITLAAVIGAILLQLPHEFLLAQPVLTPVIWVRQFTRIVIAYLRSNGIVEKGAILHDLCVADSILKSPVGALHGKYRSPRFARLKRSSEMVDTIVQVSVIFGKGRAGNLNVGVIVLIDRIMDLV